MFHTATKITIIAERLLQDGIISIVEAAGAKGYTIVDGSGKGEHFVRPAERAAVVSAFSIIRIEVIVNDAEQARDIARDIAGRFFKQYSGIVYLSEIEVLRPERF
ncbi:MAG: hypothetical protein GVY06_11780 [Alphaproteobacteria bacterium]|jgi:nitrogen regulatory protein PII|nr:hypothetical protein [Alphaproteobacteria bacterium]